MIEEVVKRLALCKTRKMQVEGQRSRFLKSSDGTRGDKDRKRKGERCIGLANYYHWFIKDFTAIARPLYDIVKKDQKWE